MLRLDISKKSNHLIYIFLTACPEQLFCHSQNKNRVKATTLIKRWIWKPSFLLNFRASIFIWKLKEEMEVFKENGKWFTDRFSFLKMSNCLILTFLRQDIWKLEVEMKGFQIFIFLLQINSDGISRTLRIRNVRAIKKNFCPNLKIPDSVPENFINSFIEWLIN